MVRWLFVIPIVFLLILGNYSLIQLTTFIEYLGEKIFPRNILIGYWFIIIILLLITFTDEILLLLNKLKFIEIKKDFKK